MQHFHAFGGDLQGLFDAVHQRVVGEGFFAEVESAALDEGHGHGHVGMAREEDDGPHPGDAARQQFFKQLQAAHAAFQAHVQHDAGRVRRHGGRLIAVKLRGRAEHGLKGFGAGKSLRHQAARAQQPGKGFAHAGIVVDQENKGVFGVGHFNTSKKSCGESAAKKHQTTMRSYLA